jgi:hypothetical protein
MIYVCHSWDLENTFTKTPIILVAISSFHATNMSVFVKVFLLESTLLGYIDF